MKTRFCPPTNCYSHSTRLRNGFFKTHNHLGRFETLQTSRIDSLLLRGVIGQLLPLLVATVALHFPISSAYSAVYFVRTNGNDALPGATWADAKHTVAAAIGAATNGDEIWVARGTYSEHVTLKPDVALYGGFIGSETARDERDWTNNLSVLWGTANKAVALDTRAMVPLTVKLHT